MGDKCLTPPEAADLHWTWVDRVPIWVITANTTDYPDKVCARMNMVRPHGPTAFIMLADDVATLRDMLPPGLTKLPRDPSDDPVIVESWI